MAEEPLPEGGSCLLGSLNLSAFVNNGTFDYKRFKHAIHVAVKGLNDVLDEGIELHPLKIQRESARDWRQIGLGVMGIADMLIKMKLTYGSKDAIEVCDIIAEFLATEAIKASQTLAEQTEPYPMWSDKVYESAFFKKHASERKPLRNSQLLTIAPTGSLSTMIGTSGGIEAVFANYYVRKTESLYNEDKYYKIFTKIAWDYLQEHGYGEDETKLPKYFVTSAQIPYKDRIDMQSIWQKHIDASISSTVNLPQSATVEDIEKLYMYAWKQGLKGVTIYRSGCAREGILIAEPKDKKDANDKTKPTTNNKLNRGDIICVDDDLVGAKRKLISGCGSLHFEVYFDELTAEPMETFINIGSGGTCERNMQLISRLISTGLRSGVPVEYIIDQCKSIKPCPAYVARTNKYGDTSKGSSCPSAIGFALEELCQKMKELYGDNTDDVYNVTTTTVSAEPKHETRPKEEDYHECPECGEKTLKFESGCQCCVNCGYSKCD